MAACVLARADYGGVNRIDQLVLRVLVDWTDQTGAMIGDIKRLCVETGYSERTLCAAIARLVRAGRLRQLTDEFGRITGNVWKHTAEKRGQWPLYRVGWFNEQGEPIR